MKISEKLTIILGITLVSIFVIGLAWSVSTGLAGFWRGLPFWIIVLFCLFLLFTIQTSWTFNHETFRLVIKLNTSDVLSA